MLHYDGGTGYGGGMDAQSEIAYLSDSLKSYDIGAPRRLKNYPYVG